MAVDIHYTRKDTASVSGTHIMKINIRVEEPKEKDESKMTMQLVCM